MLAVRDLAGHDLDERALAAAAQERRDYAKIAAWFNANRQQVRDWTQARCLGTRTYVNGSLAPAMIKVGVVKSAGGWTVFMSPNSNSRWKATSVKAFLGFWQLTVGDVLPGLAKQQLPPLPPPQTVEDWLWRLIVENRAAFERFWEAYGALTMRSMRAKIWKTELREHQREHRQRHKTGLDGLTPARVAVMVMHTGMEPATVLITFAAWLQVLEGA